MLIPLGILSAAGSRQVAGSYERIATAFGTGASGIITFSSIPQDYKHLQFRIASKTDTSNNSSRSALITINGVTTSSYAYHQFYNDGATILTDPANTQTSMRIRGVNAQSTISGRASATIIDILDYASTTKHKTIRTHSGQTGDSIRAVLVFGAGLFYQTGAVSSVTFAFDSTGNYATNTRFSLYGIRG
jgi:hypothetical protein